MDYEKKYYNALIAVKKLQEANPNDEGIQNWIDDSFPELKESEDEKVRKALIEYFNEQCDMSDWNGVYGYQVVAWLEKQGNIDFVHYEDSENEKRKFVGYGFLKCKGDFLSFREGETYWLEYIGKDNYNVRSDNLLGQTFHIRPMELYTVFRPTTWLEKQGKERKITHEEICKSYGISDIGEFSDGYHTFNGLYKQRMILFAVLVKTYKDRAWKSWKHEDGLDCFGGGWFIVGIDTPDGTYTYHYEAKDWDRFDCQVLEKAKHWDGHDEHDVERLFSLVSNANKDEVRRCLINGMKFYYEDNVEANWGTEKFSMKVKDILAWLEKQGEKKPAWSEEDENRYKDIINFLDTTKKHYVSIVDLDACIEWIKSLKKRIGG